MKNTAQSYVYAIRAIGTNRIKIGTTTNLKGRTSGVQTGCPFPVEVIATWEGDRQFETALHRELAEYRAQGEWFEVADWIIGYKAWRIQNSLHLPDRITVTTQTESGGVTKSHRRSSKLQALPPSIPGHVWRRSHNRFNLFREWRDVDSRTGKRTQKRRIQVSYCNEQTLKLLRECGYETEAKD